jgi:hypothetical protein
VPTAETSAAADVIPRQIKATEEAARRTIKDGLDS